MLFVKSAELHLIRIGLIDDMFQFLFNTMPCCHRLFILALETTNLHKPCISRTNRANDFPSEKWSLPVLSAHSFLGYVAFRALVAFFVRFGAYSQSPVFVSVVLYRYYTVHVINYNDWPAHMERSAIPSTFSFAAVYSRRRTVRSVRNSFSLYLDGVVCWRMLESESQSHRAILRTLRLFGVALVACSTPMQQCQCRIADDTCSVKSLTSSCDCCRFMTALLNNTCSCRRRRLSFAFCNSTFTSWYFWISVLDFGSLL